MALSAYDFRDHPELVRIAEEEFAPAIPLDKKETIQNACEYGNFAENMQVAPLNPDKAETMTLGELAKLGENDNNQRLDIKSIRNLGFGPQGMITRGKQKSDLRMLEMPRVLYRQEGEGEHAKFVDPANASGRHRNYFLQMYLHACGVDYTTAMQQKLWVTIQVADSRDEFAAAMLTANAGPCGPRTQAAVEKIGYGLHSRGIAISSASELIASYPGVAKVNDYPDVFGTLAVLVGEGDHGDPAKIFDVFKRAYNFAYKASSDNRAPVKQIFTLESSRLLETVKDLIAQYEGICKEVSAKPSKIAAKTRIAEKLSDKLAAAWGIQPRSHESESSFAQKKLADLQTKVAELEKVAQI